MFHGQLGCQGSMKSVNHRIPKQFLATVGENKDIKNHDKFGKVLKSIKHCDIGFQICMNTLVVFFDF